MIDGSEKRKRQLAFELQNSRVYEKRSKALFTRREGNPGARVTQTRGLP